MTIKYILVKGKQASDLQIHVQDAIDQGYLPHGPVIFSPEVGFIQPMIKGRRVGILGVMVLFEETPGTLSTYIANEEIDNPSGRVDLVVHRAQEVRTREMAVALAQHLLTERVKREGASA